MMDAETTIERRMSYAIWLCIAVVAATVLAAGLFGRHHINWLSFAVPAFAATALCGGAAFYARTRRDIRLAAALVGTAQLLAFAAVAAPLSYVAASLGGAFHDSAFDAFDRALGLDWHAWLAWMNAHPTMHKFFYAAYSSFTIQASATILVLGFSGRLVQLRLFMLAFAILTLITIAGSALWPAEGVWGYHHITPAQHPDILPATREMHLPILQELRNGNRLMLQASGAEGIITFPSLHAAAGLLFIFALWSVPWLRWVSVAVNSTMIVATPVDGGHYFADVLAGLVIATLVWFVLWAMLRRSHATEAQVRRLSLESVANNS